MRLVRNPGKLRRKFKNPVLTIGIFDGMHLGHQKIIKEVVREAAACGGTSIVLTFACHPLKIFKKNCAIPLINSLEHRINFIKSQNVDVCMVIDFNSDFSRMSAGSFVKHILVDAIGIKYLIVGKGFRFGRERTGTFSFIKKLSAEYGFKVRRINPVKLKGRIISSSSVRRFIMQGKINQANEFLGRELSILGRVVKGSQRGKILGYPTANIMPRQEIVPAAGVYAIRVKLDNKMLPGIANIGYRPTFHSQENSPRVIEAHIFNFRSRLYGRRLEVFFIRRIRPEKRFASHSALLAQIKKDERKARQILKI
jgi:riboflavin kinase/FMN adenylyltransferase